MKLSIRAADETEEVSVKNFEEAKEFPDKTGFLIINNHDEKPYKACKKIKLSDVAMVEKISQELQ